MSSFDYWDIETGEGITDYELHRRYDEMLDETVEPWCIGDMYYDPSRVLKEVDPIAYRVGFSDWLDSELGETLTDEDPEA